MQLVHAAALVHGQAEVGRERRLEREVVAGRALVAALGRAAVAAAGAAVAQRARLDEALALVVGAARQRQHGQVQALHALQRQVLELL